MIDRGIRTALSQSTVAALIFPNDLQDLPYQQPPRKHGAVLSGVGYCRPKILPFASDLRRAADVLNSGERVAMLIGAGALEATDEVISVAQKLNAGCAKALLGKAALPDDLPWVTGSSAFLELKRVTR